MSGLAECYWRRVGERGRTSNGHVQVFEDKVSSSDCFSSANY